MNLNIGGKKFDFFNRFEITLDYDSVASDFSFEFFFNPEIHKALHNFRDFSKVVVEHEGETIITGRAVIHDLNDNPSKVPNTIAGYSLPGILEDVTIPPSLYPLQNNGKTLKQIATELTDPFGISVVVDPEVSSDAALEYDETDTNEGTTIKSYLADLASQRGIVLSHNDDGALYLTKAKTKGTPVLRIDEGGIPNLSMKLRFNGQGIHDEIHIVKDADVDAGSADETSVTNPYSSISRPITKVLNSGAEADMELALKAAIGQDLQNIVLTLSFDRWELGDAIIRPNTIITVQNANLMMSEPTKWFVKQVKLVGDQSSFKSTVTCVLPEVYSGDTPSYVFDS